MYDLFNQPTDIVHRRENNPDSEAILNAGRKKFNRHCEAVFSCLMEGKTLTTTSALLGIRWKHHTICIGDLRRRIKDLKENGVRISDRLTEERFKEWYMTDEDKSYNLKM